jgi:hypothetical protein
MIRPIALTTMRRFLPKKVVSDEKPQVDSPGEHVKEN